VDLANCAGNIRLLISAARPFPAEVGPAGEFGYVTLLLDGDRLIVSTNGYIYCLDPLTGQILWNNPLRGYGSGAPTSLTSVRGQSSQALIHQAAAAETAKE